MTVSSVQTLSLDQLEFIGHGLVRPECALAHSSGLILVPDWTDLGGVSVIFPDGTVKRHLAKTLDALDIDGPLRPNGICLLDRGCILLAHLGNERGGVFKLHPDGAVTAILTQIDGQPLPPTNFVTIDDAGRMWVTVSTRKVPRANAYRSDVADGFIVQVENGQARIVADNLGYTNECLPHPDGKRLFVNETFARRLSSFDIADDGGLSNKTTIAEFGKGTFPDGLAFDLEGNAWITSIISNRLLRVSADGQTQILVQDVDPPHLDCVEQAWQTNSMSRPHLDKAAGNLLRNVSNMAFLGESLDHAVLGCLLDDRLATLPMPVAGHQPVHWTFNIDPLIKALNELSAVKKHEPTTFSSDFAW